jgi:hypothetical protein
MGQVNEVKVIAGELAVYRLPTPSSLFLSLVPRYCRACRFAVLAYYSRTHFLYSDCDEHSHCSFYLVSGRGPKFECPKKRARFIKVCPSCSYIGIITGYRTSYPNTGVLSLRVIHGFECFNTDLVEQASSSSGHPSQSKISA